MLSRLVSVSLRQGVLVLVLAGMLIVGGIYAFLTIPIDAFPDVTTVLVQVITKAPGLSPAEVERSVTFPLELQLTGAPGLVEVRSMSKVGLSMIDVLFRDDVDINLARQVVFQRLLEVQALLPPDAHPELVPNTSGLSEVYQYYLESPTDREPGRVITDAELMERRTLQDWVIRPLLKGTPDVVDVNAVGGFVKQYQVVVEPGLLRKYALALHEVFDAVAQNNANAGGNILEKDSEKYIVRGIGLIKTVEDIESIVVKQVAGTPIYVRDVADVRIGHAVRHGAVVVDARHEAVAGMVLMLRGGNARNVVESVKEKIDEIHRHGLLPNGLRIIPFYDRLELIASALSTVYKALLEGIVLVVIVLLLFLGNVRSALVVTATLIVTPLATFIAMHQFGLTANLMSLGGMVIAIGMMVDGSVVVVENAYRLLSESHGRSTNRFALIVQAVTEVGQPVIFGILIIILVFFPILSLEGMEGKLFHPLAYTIMIALLVSLVVSLTLSPVLCYFGLQQGHEEDTTLVRWAKCAYRPALAWSLAHRGLVLTIAVSMLLASMALFPLLGGEFIPILNEVAITPQTIRLPSISLAQSIEIEKDMQRAVMEFPEVRSVVSKIGRSELGNDPQEANASDPIVALAPMDTWTTATTKAGLDDAVRQRLQRVPGASFLLSQPIQQRVDELVSGVRSEATVKILGDDLTLLRTTAETIQEILAAVPGVKDVRTEQLFGQAYLTIDIDRRKIARHGINVAHIRDIITTAIGAEPATRVYEGQRRFDLILRYPEQYRDSVEDISNILVTTASGALVPLADLATVAIQEGPSLISREGLQRRIYVGFNTAGRDIQSIVEEAQRKIAQRISLPAGYQIKWGGAFENMQRAMARLQLIVPLTIGLIFLLLFSSFNSARYAALIILNLPFALIGGVIALFLTGEYLSVPASVGFINLFGVAVLNGIVLVSYINTLREEGLDDQHAVTMGCLLRLRPVLTTALVALLGLVPLAFSHGVGSEVQRPLAVVVIGGLVSSTLLTLLVLPAAYGWFAPARPPRTQTPTPTETPETETAVAP